MSAHTPGPWSFVLTLNDQGYARRAIVAGNERLALLDREDSENNARLIAAAPKLLTALKVLAEWGPLAESIDVAEFRIDVANALAAIAEAEGES